MELEFPLTSNVMTHMVHVERTIKGVLRDGGTMNVAEYRVLSLLSRMQALTPGSLAKTLGLSLSAVAVAAGGLVEAGYVTCSEGDADRRLRCYAITEAGSAALEAADRSVSRAVASIWAPLSAAQRTLIIDGCVKNEEARRTREGEPPGGVGAKAIALYVENALLVNRLLNQIARRRGVSLGGFRVLFRTYELGGAARPAELARSLVMRPNEVTVAVDELAGACWVGRGHDPSDRRGSVLTLTKTGSAFLELAAPEFDAMFCGGTYQTDAGEREAFRVIGDLVVGAIRR